MLSVRQLIVTFLLTFICLIASKKSIAQLSYAGANLTYHNVRFDGSTGISGTSTRINSLSLNLDYINRIRRNFAVGSRIRIPLSQSFTFKLGDREIDGYSVSKDRLDEDPVPFAGGNLDYNIQNNISLTLLGRIYADVEWNIYFDVRYTFENYRESFSYSREASMSYSAANTDYSENITVSGFGIGAGATPKVSERFYVNYGFSVDFIGTSKRKFSYEIDGQINSTDVLLVKTKIDSYQVAYELSCGLGYVF